MFSGVAVAPPIYFKSEIKGKADATTVNGCGVSALTECKKGRTSMLSNGIPP